MRQVPPYLLIGSGRVSRHFQCYLDLLNIPYQTWSRRQNSPQELQTLSESASTVLLLISDKAIASFIEEHPCLQGKRLVHFSGCLSVPGVYSAHPLTSFASDLQDLAAYQAIPFILSQDGPEFSELLPGLPNSAYRIPEASRPYYHALCVLSGNFTVLLWQKIFKEFEERFQVPKEMAFPYLQQIMRNLLENPLQALTGPLARNDQNTIAANLQALDNDAFQPVYQAFLETYRRIK
jgi:predicted short-subunit dehydrogenase-like oxidoreductase (DUF2520 family)